MSKILMLFLILPIHSFHLSITQVEIFSNGEIEVAMTLFADDLEKGINANQSIETIDVFNSTKTACKDSLINKYLKERFSIKSNGKKIILNYLGHELEGNRCHLYLEGKIASEAKKIELTNSCLMDFYDDQKNVVHLKKGEFADSYLLDLHNKLAVLQ